MQSHSARRHAGSTRPSGAMVKAEPGAGLLQVI
jgi:hypothetical protein